MVCRSTQAHRLSVKAYQVGGQAMQQQLISLVFDACFAKGEDISNDNFLADIAVKVGLMNRGRVCFSVLHNSLGSDALEAIEFLKSTETLDCVEKMIEAARANGVNGVPFIIIDGKWALNGVQSMDCYLQVSSFFSHVSVTNVSGRSSESWLNHTPLPLSRAWPSHVVISRIQ